MEVNIDSIFDGDLTVVCLSDYTFNNTVEFKKDEQYRADISSIEPGLIVVIDPHIPVRVGMNIDTYKEHFNVVPPAEYQYKELNDFA